MPCSTNVLSAAQCRAARAMVEWSTHRLAEEAAVDAETIREFELRFRRPDATTLHRIRLALEQAGISFIPENGRGAGVQFKFNTREVRAIKRWESEGGLTGRDAIY